MKIVELISEISSHDKRGAIGRYAIVQIRAVHLVDRRISSGFANLVESHSVRCKILYHHFPTTGINGSGRKMFYWMTLLEFFRSMEFGARYATRFTSTSSRSWYVDQHREYYHWGCRFFHFDKISFVICCHFFWWQEYTPINVAKISFGIEEKSCYTMKLGFKER
jgi:hypothetical protein